MVSRKKTLVPSIGAVLPSLIALSWAAVSTQAAGADGPLDSSTPQPVVIVNGSPITTHDLELQLALFREDRRDDPNLRDRILDQLIQQRLMSAWLDERQIPVDSDLVEARIELLERILQARGQSLEEVLAQFGRTADSLREEQALPVRWQTYVRRTVSQNDLANYFDNHRSQLDGTRVRLRQIVLTVPPDASEEEWEAAARKLIEIRDAIVARRITFEEAAQHHSMSPTARQGGDIGLITPRGQLPPEVSQAAFSLEVGRLSEAIRSARGWHLIEVTEIRPGQLSLEDARPEILRRLGDDLWNRTVQSLLEQARIEHMPPRP